MKGGLRSTEKEVYSRRGVGFEKNGKK